MTAHVTDSEIVTYLRYSILVRENHLTIFTPNGFLIYAGRIELSTARKMIRDHRAGVA